MGGGLSLEAGGSAAKNLRLRRLRSSPSTRLTMTGVELRAKTAKDHRDYSAFGFRTAAGK
jgi:hypothetical protein